MMRQREREKRLGALEVGAERALEADIRAFAVRCGRVFGALTPAEWFLARVLYHRDAVTPEELALVARVKELEDHHGVTALGEALTRKIGKDALIARRDAAIEAVYDRSDTGAPLSPDDRDILAGHGPFDALCRAVTNDELQALIDQGDEREELVQTLARKYGFVVEEGSREHHA